MISVSLSIIYCGLTLYMMAILLRWLGPWLELEFHGPVLGLLPKATDPLVDFMKRVLPNMGPMDFSPMAAVMCVYIVRLILVRQ
jgi:YggT family protein